VWVVVTNENLVSVREGSFGKPGDLENPPAVFPPISGGLEEGREKRQRFHKLLMVPYS